VPVLTDLGLPADPVPFGTLLLLLLWDHLLLFLLGNPVTRLRRRGNGPVHLYAVITAAVHTVSAYA